MNNFNLIASVYDSLAKLVFGKSLLDSQTYFLPKIKESDSVLILGGGTGKLLKHLPQCKQVHFVELSSRMLARAKNRDCKTSVDFIQADFLNQDFSLIYDVIICPFFLDCFDEKNMWKSLIKIKSLLNPEAILLVSDFQKTRRNGFLLKFMHLFFRISVSLQSRKLNNIHQEVLLVGLNVQEEKFFHRNMIFSRLYGNL